MLCSGLVVLLRAMIAEFVQFWCNRAGNFVLGRFRNSAIESGDCLVDMGAMDVRVPRDHRKGLVAADLLDCRQIRPALNEPRDSRVTHDMRRDHPRIQAGTLGSSRKWPTHLGSVTARAELGSRRGKYPTLGVVGHVLLFAKDVGQ